MPKPNLTLRAAAAAAGLLLASHAGAAAQERLSPYSTSVCPIPANVVGYPVTVRAGDGAATLDSAYARALADAVARRWLPPSQHRRELTGAGRVFERVHTPVPIWPEDWSPDSLHRARLVVTLRRGGEAGPVRFLGTGPDGAFNRSLESIFDASRAGGAPGFPALPAGLDSVRVSIGFGLQPEAADVGLVRFARQQRAPVFVPGTFRTMESWTSRTVARTTPLGEGPPRLVVKYDVDAAGNLAPGSIQVVQTSSRDLQRDFVTALRRARWEPGQADCRPIPQTVVQRYGIW